MMRLRDQVDSSDPHVAEAARLLAQVHPLVESDVRAARVRRALDRDEKRWRFRGWVAAFAGVLSVVGTAGAVIGVANWMDESPPAELSKAASDQAPRPDGIHLGREGKKNRGDGAVPNGIEAECEGSLCEKVEFGAPQKDAEPSSSSQEISSPRPATPSRSTATHSVARGVAPKAASVPTLSEARLMQQAVEALRTSGDANKAESLLQEYRKSSSSGQLEEEALALSIEVSLARGDKKAPAYAKQYLAKYPTGKFAPLARRALSGAEAISPR